MRDDEHADAGRTASVSFRLPAAMKEVAERVARDDGRSLASLIAVALQEWLLRNGHVAEDDHRRDGHA